MYVPACDLYWRMFPVYLRKRSNSLLWDEKETKETTAKINKTKSCFFEKIKLTNHSQTHQETKAEEKKSTKLEMKMERSQQTTEKYKGS